MSMLRICSIYPEIVESDSEDLRQLNFLFSVGKSFNFNRIDGRSPAKEGADLVDQ